MEVSTLRSSLSSSTDLDKAPEHEKECFDPATPWENSTMQGTTEKTAVEILPDKLLEKEVGLSLTRSETESQLDVPLPGEGGDDGGESQRSTIAGVEMLPEKLLEKEVGLSLTRSETESQLDVPLPGEGGDDGGESQRSTIAGVEMLPDKLLEKEVGLSLTRSKTESQLDVPLPGKDGESQRSTIAGAQMLPDKEVGLSKEGGLSLARSVTELQLDVPLPGEDGEPPEERSNIRVLAIMVALSVSRFRSKRAFPKQTGGCLTIRQLYGLTWTLSSAFSLRLLTRQSWLRLFPRSQQT
jgi:hypothetical protein